MPQPVIDLTSNYEENVERWARILARGPHTVLVFDKMYYGKTPRKTAKDLASVTELDAKRVTEVAKKLVLEGLLRKIPGEWPIVYEKIPEIHHLKGRLLRFARNKKKREKLPTKRKVVVVATPKKIRVSGRTRFVTVDGVGDFLKVRRIPRGRVPAQLAPPRLPEDVFKAGLQRILQDRGRFVHSPAEKNDFLTTHLRIGGKRRIAAFALKGPAVTGILTPGKMGKHGTQLQRLVSGSATVFFVQYEGQIGEDLIEQLKRLARDRAVSEQEDTYYGIIDLLDSYRLRMAYPDCFR